MADYNGTTIADLDETKPAEGVGGAKLGELDNSDREIKLCLKNTFGVEHDTATGKHNTVVPFYKTVTISPAAAGTAVEFLADTDIPSGKKVYLSGFHLKNAGAAWSGTGTLKIKDNNSTPVDFVSIPVADLTANANLWAWKAGTTVTEEDAFKLGSGGTVDKGLQIKATSNGTGGDVACTVYGIIQ